MTVNNKLIAEYIIKKQIDKLDEEQLGIESVLGQENEKVEYYKAWLNSSRELINDTIEKLYEIKDLINKQ